MQKENQEDNTHFHIFESKEKDKNIIHYDVVILGAGAAGLTAGIYSARYGLHTAIIAKEIGGMANLANKIENYPGFIGTGKELMQKFYEQAKSFNTEFLISEISNIEKDKTGFVISLADNKVVHSKTLIFALGSEKKKLNSENESRFLGRGVSYCSSCDAYFFKNKIVAVIGCGESACHSALLLSGFAKKVYFICKNDELKCSKIELEKIKHERIEIILNANVKKILGKDKVEAIELDNKKELKVDGVFIEIGSLPLTEIARKINLELDEKNFIHANANMKTNVKGVFAAGDIVKSRLKQVVVAAGQGAIAAKSAYDYLKG